MIDISKVSKSAGRWIARTTFRLCDHLIPKDNRIVLVTRPDGDDQGVSICFELQRIRWQGRIQWLVRGNPGDCVEWQARRGLGNVGIQFCRKHTLTGLWSFFRARWVFYTHGAFFNYQPPNRKTIVNLWHGMPIKRIWRGVPGSEVPLSTYLLSTSPFYSDVLMAASGFSSERMLVTGLPRNDFLIARRAEASSTIDRLKGRAKHLIVFMPTYRTSKLGLISEDGIETDHILGLDKMEVGLLHSWLKENACKMIVKPHPMSVHMGTSFQDDEQWSLVDDGVLFREGLGLYELLGQADLLVTDVSSVFVDFLITERPQIFYFPDLKRYQETRGLLLNPLEDYIPGPISHNFVELREHLNEWISGGDTWVEKRRRLRALMAPLSEDSAAASILDAVGIRRIESPEGIINPSMRGS
jgi:CDP-glycerol glycerophosphotransferase